MLHVLSRQNIADALSRLTKIPASKKFRADDKHDFVRMVAILSVPAALKIQEVEEVSAQDKELQIVRECLIQDNWEKAPKPYMLVRNEPTFIGQVLLRGTRIIVSSRELWI